ncbi:MAG: type II 3-dehydroquinate dehydratase [Actinomycetota bacterium]
MSGELLLLSGPNLNLLGERQPLIYGSETLGDLVDRATTAAATHGMTVRHRQSNHEGDLVDEIHAARRTTVGLIVNAAALTHYGRSLHDALLAYDEPKVELHISNPLAREEWRHVSVVSGVVDATISGFGSAGYELAVHGLAALIAERTASE